MVFYNDAGTGNVSTNKSDLKNPIQINGLPISLDAKNGQHFYSLTISNIGEFYDQSSPGSCKLGRLIGDAKGIYKKGTTTDIGSAAEYKCMYYENCPSCETGCIGELCELELCNSTSCEPVCVGIGCMYDQEQGLTYAYRTISLTNFNPTNRTLGYNWNPLNENKAVAVKAAATIAEIENKGEDVYEDYEYKIILTPGLIRQLKEINAANISDGGFAKNTYENCTSYGEYENAYCESSILNDLRDGTIGGSSNVLETKATNTAWLDSDYCKSHVCTTGSKVGYAYR